MRAALRRGRLAPALARAVGPRPRLCARPTVRGAGTPRAPVAEAPGALGLAVRAALRRGRLAPAVARRDRAARSRLRSGAAIRGAGAPRAPVAEALGALGVAVRAALRIIFQAAGAICARPRSVLGPRAARCGAPNKAAPPAPHEALGVCVARFRLKAALEATMARLERNESPLTISSSFFFRDQQLAGVRLFLEVLQVALRVSGGRRLGEQPAASAAASGVVAAAVARTAAAGTGTPFGRCPAAARLGARSPHTDIDARDVTVGMMCMWMMCMWMVWMMAVRVVRMVRMMSMRMVWVVGMRGVPVWRVVVWMVGMDGNKNIRNMACR